MNSLSNCRVQSLAEVDKSQRPPHNFTDVLYSVTDFVSRLEPTAALLSRQGCQHRLRRQVRHAWLAPGGCALANKPRTSRAPTLVLCAHDANKDALPLNERVPRRTGAPSLSAHFLVLAAQSRFQWPATCLTACARPNQHPSAGLDCVRAHVARALPALHSPRVHNGSFLHCCTRERTRARADPTTPRNITRCPLAQALIERSSVRRCTAHAPRMLC